jgi:NAD(P)-dependent dehydrogenase (short-subunit alcohol dehydrogenase family)
MNTAEPVTSAPTLEGRWRWGIAGRVGSAGDLRSVLGRHVNPKHRDSESLEERMTASVAASALEKRPITNAAAPVLVTGASSGIGRAVVELLASRGRSVIAGARKKADLDALAQLLHVRPIAVDVTVPAEVDRAVREIRDLGTGLHGLVNCAGVAGVGPLLDTPVEELNRVLGVNLVGTHRMVHAFGPLLVQSRGRIVNVSSIGGFLTESWLGAYGTSKHALEGYSEILHDEMATQGLNVSTIAPGAFRSRIALNYYELVGRDLESRWAGSIFRDRMKALVDWYQSTPGILDRTAYPDPAPVAEAVADALYSEYPKSRYLVTDRETALAVVDRMLARMLEVNRGLPTPLTGPELLARFQRQLE